MSASLRLPGSRRSPWSHGGFPRVCFALGALALGAAARQAQATTAQTYCVSDSAQLAQVLATANDAVTGSMTLDIRIRQGSYAIGTTQYAFVVPTTIRGASRRLPAWSLAVLLTM